MLEQLHRIETTTGQLLTYCKAANWAGWDPYDALNSGLLQSLPWLNRSWIRLIFTQALKRSPLNLRPLLGVLKTHNPKGVALFLSAAVRLSRARLLPGDDSVTKLADLLLQLRSPLTSAFSWGYSFDWQTRTELVPRGSPNIICTTFAGNALLDAFDLIGNAVYQS